MSEIKRKGARSTKDIPEDIMAQLNHGEIETANLVEWLAVDQRLLLENILKENKRHNYFPTILLKINQLKKQTVNTINEAIGTGLYEQAKKNDDSEFLLTLYRHKSDLVRCWGAYTIGQNEQLDITEMLNQIQHFSADGHFGVREISWLAVRTKIAQNLIKSIEILAHWATNPNENIRRFATEAIRPRGVWCQHIEELKQNPRLALPILEHLKSDSSKYVQDSVGNWLNDASKTQPGFVQELCLRWEKESTSKETTYIIKRALRTIGNKTLCK
jgi:3-methyladenine DNA glycosylase AlkC